VFGEPGLVPTDCWFRSYPRSKCRSSLAGSSRSRRLRNLRTPDGDAGPCTLRSPCLPVLQSSERLAPAPRSVLSKRRRSSLCEALPPQDHAGGLVPTPERSCGWPSPRRQAAPCAHERPTSAECSWRPPSCPTCAVVPRSMTWPLAPSTSEVDYDTDSSILKLFRRHHTSYQI
jgi:hypothetical protein